jgi:hypothetical protein
VLKTGDHIPVDMAHDQSVHDAGFRTYYLEEDGGVAGYIETDTGELGIENKLNDKQLAKAVQFYVKYKPTVLYSHYKRVLIKNVEEFKYYVQNPEMIEEAVEEEPEGAPSKPEHPYAEIMTKPNDPHYDHGGFDTEYGDTDNHGAYPEAEYDPPNYTQIHQDVPYRKGGFNTSYPRERVEEDTDYSKSPWNVLVSHAESYKRAYKSGSWPHMGIALQRLDNQLSLMQDEGRLSTLEIDFIRSKIKDGKLTHAAGNDIANYILRKSPRINSENIKEGLASHAQRELELAGLFDQDSDYEGMLGEAVLELMEVFAKQGHSGFSASLAADLFQRLVKFEALTPLTDYPDDWEDISEMQDGTPGWQSKRSPSCFSTDGGKTYYSLDDMAVKHIEDGCSYVTYEGEKVMHTSKSYQ